MISALSLGPMPQLVQSEMGDKALRRTLNRSGLTYDLLFSREGYIPQPALVRFFNEVAREAGTKWVLGPWVDAIQIGDYGLWGDWVLSASTLREGLVRGSRSIHLHGTHDKLSLRTRDGVAKFSYKFAASATSGYGEVAIGGAAALVSYCRRYLGPTWRPKAVLLDDPSLTASDLSCLEEWFGCPVSQSERAISLVFDAMHLDTPLRAKLHRRVTLEDVVRERIPTRPRNFTEQVRSVVQRNLADGLTGIDDTARTLDSAVRTLQKRLNANGATYRDILKTVRVERAKELLNDGRYSVTEVAYELGYEHAPHFTRMFTNEVGILPSDFARRLVS